MVLKTTLFGEVYQFRDIKEVLAKASEARSGDVLAGVAAASAQERVAAPMPVKRSLLPLKGNLKSMVSRIKLI